MKRPLAILTLVAGLAAFGYGLWRLFDLRFSSGDIYRPASTFRADPLGARALHDSVALLPDRQVRRLLEPVRRLGNGADTTLFLLGCAPDDEGWLTARTARELDDFLVQGGRVVITYAGVTGEWFGSASSLSNRVVRVKRTPGGTNAVEDLGPRTLASHWDFDFKVVPLPHDSNDVAQAVSAEAVTGAPAGLPRTVTWRSPLRLVAGGTNWQTLYAHNGDAVLLARPVGAGLLVVAGDSWFHSNEALRVDRATGLLAWLVGPSRRVVFDETHLGSQLNPGIMTLARRYRLHGLGLGLAVLAGLYVWRQASSLVPRPAPPAETDELLATHDSASGFVNLLRRALPAGELIPVCFAEWRKTVGRARPDLARKAADMQDVVNLETALPPKERNPVAAYRRLAQILSQR